jgi:hypothetical protein
MVSKTDDVPFGGIIRLEWDHRFRSDTGGSPNQDRVPRKPCDFDIVLTNVFIKVYHSTPVRASIGLVVETEASDDDDLYLTCFEISNDFPLRPV